ncbi:transcriptional regulator [Snodgrassella sp. CFCC 13594]|uniref:transcriptional regulator n=1 Tax=Snodgrassella sp. CFCC 13594 TaxID=1775559 RepID=UPI00082D4DD7|nr:transcriptional regulator [Snodgrassella sp. CFCC 13594]
MNAEKVKQGFRNRGETLKSWCERHGYEYTYTSRILNGSVKANRGKAHEIAVALGLKNRAA